MKAQSKKLTNREKELLSEIVRDAKTENETAIMGCQDAHMQKFMERWNEELSVIIEKLN